jgi:hypothetical protein
MFFFQIKYFTNWLFTMQNSNLKKIFLIFFLCFLGNYVSWGQWKMNFIKPIFYSFLTLFAFCSLFAQPVTWDSSTSYSTGALVIVGTSTYVAEINVPANNTPPNTTYWKSLEETYNSSLSTGWYHNLFTKTDGSLWGTGRNNQGQLGDGTTTARRIH